MKQLFWKTICQFIKWLNMNLPYDFTPRNLLKINENIRPYKDLMNVFNIITLKSPKLKTAQMSINLWMFTTWIYPCKMLFSNKKISGLLNVTTWINLINIILVKETRHKRPHIVFIQFIWKDLKRQVYRDWK